MDDLGTMPIWQVQFRTISISFIYKCLVQRADRPSPPHQYTSKGTYSGYVWTIPSSKYDVNEAIENWPPAVEGPKAVATKWWASLKGQTLFLARSSGLEHSYLVPVLEVDLIGCE